MNLEELREAWKSQDVESFVRTTFLLDSVRARQRRHNRLILIRNLREGWGSIVAALLLGASAESDVATRKELWLFYVAMAIVFGTGVFRVVDNRRERRRAQKYRDSALSFIDCSMLRIEHRIWLLENIFWWWVLPMGIGGLLICAQVIMLVGVHEPAVFWRVGKGAAAGVVVLAAVYLGNRWTARRYWRPRKAELEAVADSLRRD